MSSYSGWETIDIDERLIKLDLTKDLGDIRDEYIELIERIHNTNDELASIEDKRYLVMYQKFECIKDNIESINKKIGIIIHNDTVRNVNTEDVNSIII